MTRILWIGCHKLLVKTELPALRDLGYEVYRPTYLTEIYDQSAVYEVDENPSTLPREVLDILGETNFFYDSISARVSKILNDYFDVCIVTISPTWLMHVADAFKGKVIYRTYGQPYSLTTEFETLRLTSKLLNRRNFFFLPHSSESLELEHSWLKAKAIEVPYWLEDDVFELENSWDFKKASSEIGLLCPNVKNPYYLNHYRYLQRNFKGSQFRIFGVQPEIVNDKRVVGTLDRQELLSSFQKLSCFLYTYKEMNTCYLPPIEAAIIGVPILYPKGSLLSKYLGKGGPGEWADERHADKLAKSLLQGDVKLTSEILAHQTSLKNLYRKSACISRFNEVFKRLVECNLIEETEHNKTVVIPFYFPGNVVNFDGNTYSSSEGIPRVIKFFVNALITNGYGVKILARQDQMANYWGFFNDNISMGTCRVIAANQDLPHSFLYARAFEYAKKQIKKLPQLVSRPLRNLYYQTLIAPNLNINAGAIKRILEPSTQKVILIPHYYHFRNLLKLRIEHQILLYLPDYIPHLYPREFRNEIKNYEKAGRKIVENAGLVLTNSLATAEYLPKTKLRVNPGKIRVFHLPRLGVSLDSKKVESLEGKVFLFYPTQFRPNKRIDLLLRAFDEIARDYRVTLVLTGNLEHDPRAKSVHSRMRNKKLVSFIGSVSDAQMSWLYQKCDGVVLSTESEGNFPPQLIEAIFFEKPFVAPRINVILEELGEDTRALLFESNSAESLECMMRAMLMDKNGEIQKVRMLKANLLKERDEDAAKAFLSVISEAFATNRIGG